MATMPLRRVFRENLKKNIIFLVLGGKDPEMLPSCHPPMPSGPDLLEHAGLQKLVLELASFMEATPFFLASHGISDSNVAV